METKIMFRLVEETRQQCRFARFAYQELRNKLITTDAEKLFFFIDGFLLHLARIQHILWSDGDDVKQKETGESLRKALKFSEGGPLKTPSLQSECVDQLLQFQKWLETLPNSDYLDMNVMPSGTLDDSGADQYHRNLDPETMMLRVRDTQFDLSSFERDLRKIESATESWLRNNHPW